MTQETSNKDNADPFKLYKGRFESYASIPEKGRDKNDIFKEIRAILSK